MYENKAAAATIPAMNEKRFFFRLPLYAARLSVTNSIEQQ